MSEFTDHFLISFTIGDDDTLFVSGKNTLHHEESSSSMGRVGEGEHVFRLQRLDYRLQRLDYRYFFHHLESILDILNDSA